MKADGLTPDTPEERAEFWQKKCKEAERELMLQYKVNQEQSQRIANLLDKLDRKGMFTLEIDTENAAFEYPSELPRMVKEVAKKLEEGQTSGKVKDINGNTCGEWRA